MRSFQCNLFWLHSNHFKEMAPVMQHPVQVPHPTQISGSTSQMSLEKMPFLMILTASRGQFRKQVLQPAQMEGSICARTDSFFLPFAGDRFPSGSMIAPRGHISKQVPHSLQRRGSMWKRTLISPVMASSRHFLAHAPHPMHSSLILYGIGKNHLSGFPGGRRPYMNWISE